MIHIIFPKPEDAEAIVRMAYETPNAEAGITREDIEYLYKDAFTEEKLNLSKNRIIHPPAGESFFIAKDDERVVGTCRVWLYKNNNELQAIYVSPLYQRQGIGKMLWEKALEIIDSAKDTVVYVVAYNEKAINFYKKLGFLDTGKRRVEERRKMKSGNNMEEIEMIKPAEKKK
jgi:ribosomal protein S18 acetylase RimI-like enzyme